MNLHDEIFMRAVESGCKPFWHDGMFGWAWHCSCIDNRHGYDQQCSAISWSRVYTPTERVPHGTGL